MNVSYLKKNQSPQKPAKLQVLRLQFTESMPHSSSLEQLWSIWTSGTWHELSNCGLYSSVVPGHSSLAIALGFFNCFGFCRNMRRWMNIKRDNHISSVQQQPYILKTRTRWKIMIFSWENWNLWNANRRRSYDMSVCSNHLLSHPNQYQTEIQKEDDVGDRIHVFSGSGGRNSTTIKWLTCKRNQEFIKHVKTNLNKGPVARKKNCSKRTPLMPRAHNRQRMAFGCEDIGTIFQKWIIIE